MTCLHPQNTSILYRTGRTSSLAGKKCERPQTFCTFHAREYDQTFRHMGETKWPDVDDRPRTTPHFHLAGQAACRRPGMLHTTHHTSTPSKASSLRLDVSAPATSLCEHAVREYLLSTCHVHHHRQSMIGVGSSFVGNVLNEAHTDNGFRGHLCSREGEIGVSSHNSTVIQSDLLRPPETAERLSSREKLVYALLSMHMCTVPAVRLISRYLVLPFKD